MTNKFVEFADKHGLVITGCEVKLGPCRVDELLVEYTRFLDGRLLTDEPHLQISHLELLKDLTEWSSDVEVRYHNIISQILPVVTELVYTITYIPRAHVAPTVNHYSRRA